MLLTVLWALVGASILGAVVGLLARRSVSTAINQAAAIRAYWAAQECADLLRAAANATLLSRAVDPRDPLREWRNLDRNVGLTSHAGRTATCTAHLESNGARFDINRASAADLQRFFTAIEVTPSAIDSLVAAVLDWRDHDDLARPFGAERVWYIDHARSTPRNADIADERELLLIRGIDGLRSDQRAALDSCVGVDQDLIDVWHARRIVLETLPGVSASVADALLGLRQDHPRVSTLLELLPLLPESARDSLSTHYPDLIARTETQPLHWLLVSEGTSGSPPITNHMELLLSFSGTRVGVVRRRFWMK